VLNNKKQYNMKKLFRSQVDKKIAGICGGLGEYTDTDSTLWRLIFLALIFAPVPIIFFYLLAWLVIPKNNSRIKRKI
jgi:phage shock protein PspC (stress-responsive transcriptional regulator)